MNEALARNRRALFVLGLFLLDVLVIVLAMHAADYVRFHLVAGSNPIIHLPHELLLRAALLAAVAFLPALRAVGLYRMRRGWSNLELCFGVLVASNLGALAFLGLSYMLKEFAYSRLMVWIFAAMAGAGLLADRLLVKRVLLLLFRRGVGVLRIVIVGDSPVARSLAARIQKNPHGGLRVVGHLVAADGREPGGPEIGRLGDAFDALRRSRPHICVFAEPVHGREEMIALLARCQEQGIRVWLTTDLHQRYSPTMELSEAESIPVIVLGNLRLASWERVLKRLLDVAGAAACLVLAAPFLLYAALRTRREIGGPVIFRQARIGFQGRPFTILKLRAVGAGEGPDPRFCDFLRAYSLDEIPQLWNVLRGEMSLVGPRPETPERVRRYNPWNRRRLQVKPGITGLAQVAGVRGEHDFDTKSRYDVLYLEQQSLLLDLRILLKTPLAVLRRRFAPLMAQAEPAVAAPVLVAGRDGPVRVERAGQPSKEGRIPC